AASLRTTEASLLPAESADYIVELTNGLISELIGETATVTTRVETIALGVAQRAWGAGANPDQVTSVTKGFDDATMTKRWESSGDTGPGGFVYLTAAEKAELLAIAGKGSSAR